MLFIKNTDTNCRESIVVAREIGLKAHEIEKSVLLSLSLNYQ